MRKSWTFLNVADRIGARLCRDAFWAEGRCNWLAAEGGDEGTSAYEIMRPDLYGGTSGVALFLARLHAATGERIFRMTALGALRHALSGVADMPGAQRHGLYTGVPGVAYAAQCLGEHEQALRLMKELAADERMPDSVDLIGGSAGVIAASLALHRFSKAGFLLDLAVRHARWLVRAGAASTDGLSWDTGLASAKRNMTGLAHGAAGIAWALLELFHVTGEQEFRSASEGGFRYERSCFSEENGWPDFRSEPPEYHAWWCHGAAGIGLSRLRAWQVLGDETHRKEAEAALQLTERMLAEPNFNYSLCHGKCGDAELFLYAGEVVGGDRYRAIAEKAATEGLERYEKKRMPWPSGLWNGADTPGLMLGQAGIGYFYLRLHDPVMTPSVLLVS
jgi:lantibiotic modifying enzyme